MPASQKSTFKRQAPQAHKDQERLSSRKYQPSSEKRPACDNQVAAGPGRAGSPGEGFGEFRTNRRPLNVASVVSRTVEQET